MPKKSKDLVLVHGPSPDGNGVNVLRARNQRLEVGTMRPLQHGRPIHGEVVKLTPRPETPMLFDAETEIEAPVSNKAEAGASPTGDEHRGTSAGPAQVASDEYRRNWDAIWKRPSKGLSN